MKDLRIGGFGLVAHGVGFPATTTFTGRREKSVKWDLKNWGRGYWVFIGSAAPFLV